MLKYVGQTAISVHKRDHGEDEGTIFKNSQGSEEETNNNLILDDEDDLNAFIMSAVLS